MRESVLLSNARFLIKKLVEKSPIKIGGYGRESCWFCDANDARAGNFVHDDKCPYILAKRWLEE